MKYLSMLCLIVLATAGCSVVTTSILPAASSARPSDRLTLGMTRAQVSAIMAAKVDVGYDVDPVTGLPRSIEVKNLYSSEILVINGVEYQVDRYIVRAPGAARVAESELFPVVYKNGLLVAKGHEGLAALKAKK